MTMLNHSDVYQQFSESFSIPAIRPYAYFLAKRLEEGHICIPLEEPLSAVATSPYKIDRLPDLRQAAVYVGKADEAGPKPFIVDGDRIYLQRYHRYETIVLKHIREKVLSGAALMAVRKQALEVHRDLILSLGAAYRTAGLTADEVVDWQLVSAISALLRDFSIITGGPGTGKTTTLAKILRILYAIQPDVRLALAAPTGKAAQRMHESLLASMTDFPEDIRNRIAVLKPSTIHLLLGSVPDSVYFKHHKDHPLPYDLVVVDEASMIDMPMFAKLLGALGDTGRIILLGDKDQLASVEAGSLLGDLCQSVDTLNQFTDEQASWTNTFIAEDARKLTPAYRKCSNTLLADSILELRLSHRFKSQGAIGNLSRAIIRSDADALRNLIADKSEPTLSFDTEYADAVLSNFLDGYEAYIREDDIATALKKLNLLRVLVTIKDGPRGLHAMVRRIEDILTRKGWLKPSAGFYPHRPVIVTRNNYELSLFNGDIGIVRADDGGNLRVWFESVDDGIRPVVPAFLSNCETVFAMTIHKSQGSEFDKVLVVLPEGTDNPLLTRELLYTAVTRAKQEVVIQGTAATLLHAAGSMVRRISGVNSRINS